MSAATTLRGRIDVRYRTVDLVTIATLAVAFGVVFWGWGKVYEPLSLSLTAAFPPSSALTTGPWLLAGVVGGLIVRKPGAAFASEFLAAAVSSFILGGTQWGWTVFASGFFQGLGAELVLAVLLYRRFGVVAAMAAGAGAGILESLYEWTQFVAGYSFPYKLAHLGFLTLSGIVVAGLGGWLLVRALARAGVLDPFGAGREEALRHSPA